MNISDKIYEEEKDFIAQFINCPEYPNCEGCKEDIKAIIEHVVDRYKEIK